MLAPMDCRHLALVCVLCSCGSYDRLARQVAEGEVAAAESLRHDGALAYALCRQEATHAYLQMRLGLGREGPVASPLPFRAWYDKETAARGPSGPVTWSTYCQELDQTGVVFHAGVLSLRDYAVAVAALADGKDFDGSGLAKSGEAVASVAERLSAPGAVVSASKSVGSAAASLSGVVVQELRTRALKSIVGRAAPHFAKVVGSLGAYLDALDAERRLVLHHRDVNLAALDTRRDASGAFTPAAEATLAVELAQGTDDPLARTERALARDKALLAQAGAVHAELAAAAEDHRREASTRQAADALLAAIEAISNRRPEEP
jgi:hypothetical protein